MSARVLVTGATGFVGARLVARLAREGMSVMASARKIEAGAVPAGVEVLPLDLGDAEASARALKLWRWDAVVNLAPGRGAKEPDVSGQHVRVITSLIDAMPHDGSVRLLHTSSMTVYGRPERLPVREGDARRPIHAYGAAKSAADDAALAAPEPADIWILRFPGLFAPERKDGALFNFARAAKTGEPITVSADQPLPWDVLHVDDTVEAIVRALRSKTKRPGAINVSYGEAVDLVAVANRISRIGGKGSVVTNTTGITHPVFQLDTERARALLDWLPSTLDDRLGMLFA